MPHATAERSVLSTEDDSHLLVEIEQLMGEIIQYQKHIDKTISTISKLDDHNQQGIQKLEKGINRLGLSEKRANVMKLTREDKEKEIARAIQFWNEFGFEAKPLANANQTVNPDSNHISSEHFEFVFTKLSKRQLKPFRLGVRHKDNVVSVMFYHPETILTKERMSALNADLKSAPFNQGKVNWRSSMCMIREELKKSLRQPSIPDGSQPETEEKNEDTKVQ